MPRPMAGLDAIFAKEVEDAVKLAKSAETALVQVDSGSGLYHRQMHVTRIEYLYELAFLKMFISWEDFLEQSFLRYMCGHRSARFGLATMKKGASYCPDIKTAANDMLAAISSPSRQKSYVLWGNTQMALDVAKAILVKSRHQLVIAAAKTPLNHYGAIRNRIAHGQQDAKDKFEYAAFQLAKRRGFDYRAGRFLRGSFKSGSITVSR